MACTLGKGRNNPQRPHANPQPPTSDKLKSHGEGTECSSCPTNNCTLAVSLSSPCFVVEVHTKTGSIVLINYMRAIKAAFRSQRSIWCSTLTNRIRAETLHVSPLHGGSCFTSLSKRQERVEKEVTSELSLTGLMTLRPVCSSELVKTCSFATGMVNLCLIPSISLMVKCS